MSYGFTSEGPGWGTSLFDSIQRDVVTDHATVEEFDSFIERMQYQMLPNTPKAAQAAYREWRFHIEMTRRGGVWDAESGMYL